MASKRDLHKVVIDELTRELQFPEIFVFHTKSMRRMPANLVGLPDLQIVGVDGITYVEIKPLYKKSRRDGLNSAQCKFLHRIFPFISRHCRYFIVADADEAYTLYNSNSWFYMEPFHKRRYQRWAKEENVDGWL
jgi:hypothetical protein